MAAPNPNPQNPSPWSLLPAELLETISRKIADVADFARFRSVCRSWRSAAKPQNLPPHLPWLLLPYDPSSSSRSFYSISAQSTYTLDLPQTRNQNIYGSSNGWLVMFDETLNVSLFNPLTRSLFRLPPFTTFPNSFTSRFVDGCSECRNDGAAITFPLDDAEYYFGLYSFISPSSTSSNIDGIVALVIEGIPQIHYWRPGDEAWTRIDCGFGDPNTSALAIAFREGKLYAIDYSRNLAICKVGVDREATVIPSLKLPTVISSYFHLVVSAQDLLLFTCPWEYLDCDCDCDCYARELRFEYHKLEENEGTMRWKRLQGFDDCMVFLNEGTIVGGRLMPIISNAPAPGDKQKWLHHLVPPVIEGKNPKASPMDLRLIHDLPLVLTRGPLQTPDLMGPTWIVPKLY